MAARGKRDQALLYGRGLANHGLGDFITHGRHQARGLRGLLIGQWHEGSKVGRR
jgi:hypothetical protein